LRDIVVEIGIGGFIEGVNTRCKELTGFSADELLGRPISLLLSCNF